MLDDRRPARVKREQPEQLPDDVRQDDLAGREAVGVALVRMPADAVEEPPELTRRVVKPSRARPPVRAREDGAVAVLGDDPPEFARDQPARLVPRDGDERLGAALRAVRAGAVLEPPLAHHGLRDPARIVEGIHHAVPDGGRIGVLFESVQRRQLAVAHHRSVRAPVCRRQRQVVIHRVHRPMWKCLYWVVDIIRDFPRAGRRRAVPHVRRSLRAWYVEQGRLRLSAKRLVGEILTRIEALGDHPEMDRIVPELDQPFLRELIHPPFRIVYRRDRTYVRIVRIWRGERLLALDRKTRSRTMTDGSRRRTPASEG